MEEIKLNLWRILGGGEFFLSLMEEQQKIPHVINIKSIPYLIVPEASKFFDYFRKLVPTQIENPEGSVLTIDDFNNYRLVSVPETRISIFSNGRFITAIDLNVIGPRSDIVGTFGNQYVEGIECHYRHLKETLPFDLEDKTNPTTWKFVIYWSDTLIKTSALILTLLYTLFNLNDKVKITSNSDPDTADQYVGALAKRLKLIGKDFVNLVNNLYLLKCLLS
jgi:hypothetical protein